MVLMANGELVEGKRRDDDPLIEGLLPRLQGPHRPRRAFVPVRRNVGDPVGQSWHSRWWWRLHQGLSMDIKCIAHDRPG